MSEQVKKDIVVVAREGYSVLLEIDGRIFDINCHEAVNLSKMFSMDVLERCSSLSTHLNDGNLILFEEGADLSKDATVSVQITPLREETAQHITSQYEQAERDSDRTNIELETRANITETTRKQIQAQVQAGKAKILQTDKKLLANTAKAVQTTNELASPPKNRQNAMTSEELGMKVSMDISPEKFAKKQAETRDRLNAAVDADETRAETEIAKQDAEQE